MKKSVFITSLLLISTLGYAQKYVLTSPDQKIISEIVIEDEINVSMTKEGREILKLHGLSLETDKIKPERFEVKKVVKSSMDELVKPLIREKSEIYRNCYNELTINFKSKLSITFRLFNEGLAYRFITSGKDSLTITKENLQIGFSETDSVRYQSNASFSSAYESPYEFRKVSELKADNFCNLPVLIQKQTGKFVMITESDLYSYPGLWMRGTGKSELTGTNPPFPEKLSYSGNPYSNGQVAETFDYIARVSGSRSFPWRIFAVADNEEGLIANNLVYLLASKTELNDLSWIKPGVVMFDWWGKNSIYGVDFKAGVNTETAKYYIDFCAAHGFRYFLFDDGWSPKEDLLHAVPGLNIPEVVAYGKQKGVDIMLWVIWGSVQRQWNQAFDQFEKWGIKGIKMDFMNRDDQQMVEFYEKVVKKAAEKKMVVDFHGAYKPCGLSRKYPNLLTREALIEFEQSGGSTDDNTTHHNLLPYIRMFTGPMDYIPATMRNSNQSNFRPVGDYPMGQGTRAHTMALFVILSSPMEMLPDSPSDYYREKECTDFLAKIPVEWDETRLLKGKIAQYTIIARRSGENWFVGAITNNEERKIELSTSFLKNGEYQIEYIEDGINASHRATDYKLLNKQFTSGEVLELNMSPGGGWVARIQPKKQ
jgi:alpha-glucosidase